MIVGCRGRPGACSNHIADGTYSRQSVLVLAWFRGEVPMANQNSQPVYSTGEDEPTYLDIQAEVGITKHMGGYEATDELYRLCHLDEAEEVLDVGCGIGVGPAYIAKRYGCRVIAVDISDKMLHWARQRAEREGVADRITFQRADVRDLPFESDRFDAVLVESVLAFVADKDAAIRELIRVTRPGGYVGVNESFWTEPPPQGALSKTLYLGTDIITEAEWRALWERMPLAERTIRVHPLSAKQEVRDRIRWIGWRSILPAWGRVIKLVLTRPRAREALKEQMDAPTELIDQMRYGLFAGRKPVSAAGDAAKP
jgi:ubiquinone/menaquinone biosynthesis C-methylase UbiE